MIRLRVFVQRRRRSIVLGAALATVCLALAWAHSAPAAHEMGAGSDEMGQAISICLAVIQVAAGLLAIVAATAWTAARRAPLRTQPADGFGATASRLRLTRWPRAGPATLQVFLR